MAPHRPNQTLRTVFRAPLRLYDWNAGWLVGHRFLRLTHVGRRSGKQYQTVLEVMMIDHSNGDIMVMAGFGRKADWLRNIETRPIAEITIGSSHFAATHTILDEDDAVEVLAEYEHRNWWMLPVIRPVLSKLVGWDYDGSDEARHLLVRELPIVAFHPTKAG
ncbi:MAG TPA: nitroreductase family deazaflavin-dependent oxidoreductase [Pseudonocardiaceae bacterium]